MRTSAHRSTPTTRIRTCSACFSTPSCSRPLGRRVSSSTSKRCLFRPFSACPPPSPPPPLLHDLLLLDIHLHPQLLLHTTRTAPTTPNAHTALITVTVSQSSISYQLFAFARAAHQRRRAGNVAGSAGKRNDDVRTCSLSNTEGSTQGTYNGRSTSAGQGGQQQGDGSKSGQQSMEGVTQHRNRNAAAAAAAQRLDPQSINSREAQPVAGSPRLFLAALFPIGASDIFIYCLYV